MCSSCGGGRRAARLPGGTGKNPIVFGEPNGQAGTPATFLVKQGRVKVGDYKYVSGKGVQQAVDDGIIELRYRAAPRVVSKARAPVGASHQYYVLVGNKKWVGFNSKPAAERFAAAKGVEVQTRDEVLKSQGGAG